MYKPITILVAITFLISCSEATQTSAERAAQPAVESTELDVATPQSLEVEASLDETNSAEDSVRPNLNLTLPTEENTDIEDLDFTKAKVLPDLFAAQQEKERKRLAVGAKVISDPDKQTKYSEKLKGAEVTIEVLTSKD